MTTSFALSTTTCCCKRCNSVSILNRYFYCLSIHHTDPTNLSEGLSSGLVYNHDRVKRSATNQEIVKHLFLITFLFAFVCVLLHKLTGTINFER